MKIVSSITHPQVFPNLKDFRLTLKHKAIFNVLHENKLQCVFELIASHENCSIHMDLLHFYERFLMKVGGNDHQMKDGNLFSFINSIFTRVSKMNEFSFLSSFLTSYLL